MIKYILLGVVQGLTEFLPVSSSGHLVILQKVLGIPDHQVAISVALHLGTLLAIAVFFGKDILNLFRDFKRLFLVVVVVIITGVIGVLGKNFFENFFSSVKLIGVAWVFTGILLISTKRITQLNRDELKFKDALILGLTQSLAIVPGISRSGITLSTLFFRKVNRDLAFSFSFLVSIPIILGAVVLESKKIAAIAKTDIINLGIGMVFSFVVGLAALLFLRKVIHREKFYYFGYYCLLMAAVTWLFIR